MKMSKIAAGFILFRRVNTGIEYLLLQTSYGQNHWTPPKGHVDPGEEPFITAQRETQEEAGLTPDKYKVIDHYKETLTYMVNGKPKIVYYWLAELLKYDTKIDLSDEHIDFRWGNLEQTKSLSGFQDMNGCFDRAEQLLTTQ